MNWKKFKFKVSRRLNISSKIPIRWLLIQDDVSLLSVIYSKYCIIYKFFGRYIHLPQCRPFQVSTAWSFRVRDWSLQSGHSPSLLQERGTACPFTSSTDHQHEGFPERNCTNFLFTSVYQVDSTLKWSELSFCHEQGLCFQSTTVYWEILGHSKGSDQYMHSDTGHRVVTQIPQSLHCRPF